MKNKFKHILLSLLMSICMMFGYMVDVNAASYSVSISSKSVSPGGSVTVRVNGNGCEGSFAVSASNGASVTGENPIWTGESITVKAGSSNFTITVSPQSVASSDTGEPVNLSSKSFSITVKSPSTSPSTGGSNGNSSNSSTNVEIPVVDNRSKDNTLSSLSVSVGQLSPSFSASKTSYSLELTSETESLTISAKAKDSKAKVSGTGKKALKIGNQTFEVVCIAENGSKKTYRINVNVIEKPTVFTQYGDSKLGILRSAQNVKAPKDFVGTNVKLENQDIPAWINEKSGLTLVYLMDDKENKNFYIYENGKILRKYETIEISGKTFTLVDMPKDLKGVEGLKSSKVKINDVQFDCWSYDDEALQNYSIVYLMNSDGKAQLYSYEGTEGTLQIYTPATESDSMNTLTYVFIGTTVVASAVAIAGFVMYFNFKKKSISAIKDYYEKKNQG